MTFKPLGLFLTLSAFETGTDFSLLRSLDTLEAGPVPLALSATGVCALKLQCLEPGRCPFHSLSFVELACHSPHKPLHLMTMTLSSPHLACEAGVEACGDISVPDVTGRELETTTAYGGKVFRGYMKQLDCKNVPLEHCDLTGSDLNCASWQ